MKIVQTPNTSPKWQGVNDFQGSPAHRPLYKQVTNIFKYQSPHLVIRDKNKSSKCTTFIFTHFPHTRISCISYVSTQKDVQCIPQSLSLTWPSLNLTLPAIFSLKIRDFLAFELQIRTQTSELPHWSPCMSSSDQVCYGLCTAWQPPLSFSDSNKPTSQNQEHSWSCKLQSSVGVETGYSLLSFQDHVEK